MGVNLKGEESSFFSPIKGLRQEDPISPLLFNLVVDVLTRMLDRGASSSLIKGLQTEFTPSGIIFLQYADSTISHLRNLK